MTIKEISVGKKIQTFLVKKKDLRQTVFFSTAFQSNQYYRNTLFRLMKSRNNLHLKLKIAKQTFHIMTNSIGLPRPFY